MRCRPQKPSTRHIVAQLAISLGCAFALLTFVGTGESPAAVDTSDDAAQRLESIEAEIEKGEEQQQELRENIDRTKKEARELRSQLVAAAAKVQSKEEELDYLETRLDDLTALERVRTKSLEKRRNELLDTLAALQRLSRQPDSALLVHPGTPLDTVRSASLLGQLVPELETDARQLGEEIAALDKVRGEIALKRNRVAETTSQLHGQRLEIDHLLKLKEGEEKRIRADAAKENRRLSQLAAKAQDLRDLIERLQDSAGKRAKEAAKSRSPRRTAKLSLPPSGVRPFSTARGKLPLPVRGRILRRFGENDASGLPIKGITVETREYAQVVTPYDGQILFAGPFRGYGQLLIIAHGEGYHSLLAGMSRINGVVGQWLLAGEPVGQMGLSRQKNGAAERPSLYVELRRKNEPINPLPWLEASERKVSG